MQYWTRVLMIVGVTIALGGGRTRRLWADFPPGPMARLADRLSPASWDLPEIDAPRWNLPSLRGVLPGGPDRRPIIQKKDGLLDDVSETAKQGWWNTKATLHPRRLDPTKLFAGRAKRPPKRVPAGARQDDSPGIFGSIFGDSDESSERVATMEDFMNRPRPRR